MTLREAAQAAVDALGFYESDGETRVSFPVDRDGDSELSAEAPFVALRAALVRSESPSPEGLDVERLAEAVAVANRRFYADMLDTLMAQKIKAVYDAGMAEPGARPRRHRARGADA